MAERQEANWRGLPAWRVATDDLWVQICPERGGKVMSVFHVSQGRDFLVPAPLRAAPRPLTYGSLWTSYDLCCWDDAFPTLGECAYPGAGRLAGVRLPEHGEAWSRDWDDETSEAAGADVVLSVRGMALPYVLRKRLSVADTTLTLAYELANEGDEPIPFQWAAYPLFAKRLIGAEAAGDDWAAVVDTDRGCWLRMAWDRAEVPWYRRIEAEDYVVLSPTTADGPDLESAVAAGRFRSVAPGETARWSVTVTAGTGPLP